MDAWNHAGGVEMRPVLEEKQKQDRVRVSGFRIMGFPCTLSPLRDLVSGFRVSISGFNLTIPNP